MQLIEVDLTRAISIHIAEEAIDAVDSVRVRHRKGVPVICVKEPGRKLFLELAPESDLSAATWASTLTHLVRLARESSAFS